MADRVLLASGGLDSFALWRYLGKPPQVYYRLGHRYQDRELATLVRLQTHCQSLGLDFEVETRESLRLGHIERDDAFIPLRNLLFAAMVFAEDDEVTTVYIGACRGDSSRDKCQTFYHWSGRLLSFLLGRRVHISAPYERMTKTDVVRDYRERFTLDSDLDLLLATGSCYTDHETMVTFAHCGECMACFRRWVALTLNGIEDPSFVVCPAAYGEKMMSSLPDWSSKWERLRKISVREWPGVIENQFRARQALRKYRDACAHKHHEEMLK